MAAVTVVSGGKIATGARSLRIMGGGVVYVLSCHSLAAHIYKSTDYGATFNEMDAAHAPAASGNNRANLLDNSAHSTATTHLYVARLTTALTTIRVSRFDMTTDLWESTDIGSANAATNGGGSSLFGAVRSDGDVLVVYTDNTSPGSGVRVARYEGSSWGATTVATGTSAGKVATDAFLLASDRLLCIYIDAAADDCTYRTLNSANSLGTETDTDATANSTNRLFVGHRYDIAGTPKVAMALKDSGGELDFLYNMTEGATLGAATTVNGISGNAPTGMPSITDYGGQFYVAWTSSNTVNWDVSDDLSSPAFGTDTTISVSGVLRVEVRGGPASAGVGILYEDASNLKFDWLVYPVVTATVNTGSHSVSGQTIGGTAGALGGVSTGSYSVSGQSITGTAGGTNVSGAVSTGSHAVSGQSIAGSGGSLGTVNTGSHFFGGQGVGATGGALGSISTQGLAVSGQSIGGRVNIAGVIGTGNHAVTGQSIGGYGGALGSISTQALAVSGQSIAAIAGALGSVGTGNHAVDGQPITGLFTVTGAVSAGELAVSGQSISAIAGALAVLLTGELAISGQLVSGSGGALGQIGVGSHSADGQAVAGGTSTGATGAVDTGALLVSGQAIGAMASILAAIATGVLGIDGQAIVASGGALGSIGAGGLAVDGGAISAYGGAQGIIASGGLAINPGLIGGTGGACGAIGSSAYSVLGQPLDALIGLQAIVASGGYAIDPQLITARGGALGLIETGELVIDGHVFTVIILAVPYMPLIPAYRSTMTRGGAGRSQVATIAAGRVEPIDISSGQTEISGIDARRPVLVMEE